VDDFEPAASVVDGGGVGDGDSLKFWADISVTRVGDRDRETLSSSLTVSGSDLISMVVKVVIAREEVAVKYSLALAGADKSATPFRSGSNDMDRIWLDSCFTTEYTSVTVMNVQEPGLTGQRCTHYCRLEGWVQQQLARK
jgi:hypothetical protein